MPSASYNPGTVSRTIFLARHGETEWNRIGRWQGATDVPLSDVGRAQAQALAARIAALSFAPARVHASGLARARETGEIVAAALGLPPPQLDPRLGERGFGCFEGLTREECALRHPAAWAAYLADRRSTPPGGEPQGDVVARMLAGLSAVGAATDDGTSALVVSHGGAIRAFVHAVTGAVPAPVGNGALLRATWVGDRFVSVDLLYPA